MKLADRHFLGGRAEEKDVYGTIVAAQMFVQW